MKCPTCAHTDHKGLYWGSFVAEVCPTCNGNWEMALPRESIELNSSRRSLADASIRESLSRFRAANVTLAENQIITLQPNDTVENLSSAEDRANGVYRFAVTKTRDRFGIKCTTKPGSIFDIDPITLIGTSGAGELFEAMKPKYDRQREQVDRHLDQELHDYGIKPDWPSS